MWGARRAKGYLGRAMHKHGVEAFTAYVLIEVDESELDKWEQFYVAYFNTNHSRGGHGYNLDDGGRARRNYRHTSPSRAKMKLSRARFIANNPNYARDFGLMMKKMWQDPAYRDPLMVHSPVPAEQLGADALSLGWDGLAQKYDVSATTIKRWFKELAVIKQSIKQKRIPWTPVEEQRLMELYNQGKLVRTIAQELGRGESSIKKRIQLLCNRMNIPRSRYRRGV